VFFKQFRCDLSSLFLFTTPQYNLAVATNLNNPSGQGEEMKHAIWFCFFCATGAAAIAGLHLPYLEFEPALKLAGKEPFIEHSGPAKFDNWLAVNVPHGPATKLKALVESKFQVTLQGRPESHITVLTPPEYWVIEKVVSMNEINALVKKTIQKSRFDVVCLGRGMGSIDGKLEQTFFVVVRSADLLALRESIQKLVVKKGGAPEWIQPDEFFPHITIGFTKSDLHLDQGVIKDVRACVANLRELP
jgi:2'-5' RNA ligase